MDPVNPLYCIPVWCFHTIYVKLGTGGRGHTSKLKMVMTLFSFFTGNEFALIPVSMMRMSNYLKTEATLF